MSRIRFQGLYELAQAGRGVYPRYGKARSWPILFEDLTNFPSAFLTFAGSITHTASKQEGKPLDVSLYDWDLPAGKNYSFLERGDSGGPVFDGNGRLVGVNSQVQRLLRFPKGYFGFGFNVHALVDPGWVAEQVQRPIIDAYRLKTNEPGAWQNANQHSLDPLEGRTFHGNDEIGLLGYRLNSPDVSLGFTKVDQYQTYGKQMPKPTNIEMDSELTFVGSSPVTFEKGADSAIVTNSAVESFTFKVKADHSFCSRDYHLVAKYAKKIDESYFATYGPVGCYRGECDIKAVPVRLIGNMFVTKIKRSRDDEWQPGTFTVAPGEIIELEGGHFNSIRYDIRYQNGNYFNAIFDFKEDLEDGGPASGKIFSFDADKLYSEEASAPALSPGPRFDIVLDDCASSSKEWTNSEPRQRARLEIPRSLKPGKYSFSVRDKRSNLSVFQRAITVFPRDWLLVNKGYCRTSSEMNNFNGHSCSHLKRDACPEPAGGTLHKSIVPISEVSTQSVVESPASQKRYLEETLTNPRTNYTNIHGLDRYFYARYANNRQELDPVRWVSRNAFIRYAVETNCMVVSSPTGFDDYETPVYVNINTLDAPRENERSENLK